MKKKTGKALVVGAGISGIRSALDLAESGYRTILIDRAENLGGTLRQLDFQFPNDRCGMCRMLPMAERDSSSQFCMRKGLFHENIEILLNTELVSVEGEPGKFLATLKRKQGMIDTELCTGCGECEKVCPVETGENPPEGFLGNKAVRLPIPGSLPSAYAIDPMSCTRCGECEKVCPEDAIDLTGERICCERVIEVGAIVLAAGFTMCDPGLGANTYGYGEFKNVVTSLEFENLVRASGRTRGLIPRPGDGKDCKKIAWLQCVGSRNIQENAEFCSSICCMFSIKEAQIAKEMTKGNVDAAIFYMDMRTFGKDFQRYRDRAENEQGVRFVRSRVHSIEPADSGSLRLVYAGIDGVMHEEIFDMAVLATGARLPAGSRALAKTAGIDLNPWGFLAVPPYSPGKSGKEGIYLSGSCTGPMDISESVISASSAALGSSAMLHSMGGGLSQVEPLEKTSYRDVSREIPRTAVALCACSGLLSDEARLSRLRAKLEDSSPNVSLLPVERLCTKDGWDKFVDMMKGRKENRILVGACLPHVFSGKMKELSMDVSLPPTLMELIDTRTPASILTGDQTKRAEKEILSLLAMGVSKLERSEPPVFKETSMVQKALVVGGGIAGMSAALAIADHGFEVTLTEESGELGTILRKTRGALDGSSPEEILSKKIALTEKHPLIRVMEKARVISTQGRTGRFLTTIEKEDGSGETIEHGVAILAPSGMMAGTDSYSHGMSESILTQYELEEKLYEGLIDPSSLQSVAMIQCVDSREKKRNYCSRVCCASALKNALYFKEKNPEIDLYVFYRDMMAYGFQEAYYNRARKAGVIFIQYDPEKRPEVLIQDGKLRLSAEDPILGREIVLTPDLLVLSTGIVPSDHRRLAGIFGVELNEDGFFTEACSKWRPVDAMKEGIFLCGIAHSPRNATESIATADAAAQRCLALLGRETIAGSGVTAEVRHSLCSRCERCIEACPYGARWLDEDEEKIQVSETGCQGCGACAAACPNSAAVLRGMSDRQVLSILDAALEDVS